MITEFNTTPGSSGTKSSGTNQILLYILIAAAAYATYKYVIKPKLDKNKETQ